MNYRKFLAFMLIALMMLSLCACGKKEQDDPDTGIDLEPIPSAPAHTGSTVKGSPFEGSFSCSWSSVEHSPTDDPSWEGRISKLTIREDGTFTLTFDSLSDGSKVVMATVSGTVSVKDDIASCTVTDRSSDSYLGSDVEEFTLTLMDKDDLRYKGDQQGIVGNRDIFSRDNA